MIKILLLLFFSNILFAQTDLRYKISQMLIVGFPGTELTDTMIINDIQQRKVGGVILFSGNITSPAQIQELNASLQSISQTPLFIAVDQEGGRVARLKAANGFEDTFTAEQIGIFNDETGTRSWAGQMADWLDQTGFNLNLAPVADVNVNPFSPAIGNLDRSFSAVPDTVYQHCSWFIDEFGRKNILTALKHFPGHGSAAMDSHLGFTDITATWADSELTPYRNLINDGYSDFIMSGHLFNSNLDADYPASLSNKTIAGLLRDSIGFTGPVITDGMFMGAITNNYAFDEAVELAINAGNDMLLYTSNKLGDKSLVDSVVNIVMDKISGGSISEERIDESYDRIMSRKIFLTGISGHKRIEMPYDFSLTSYPNPFNSYTQIVIKVPAAGNVSVTVFNSIGEEIAGLFDDYLDSGVHKIFFNGNELSSGIYLLRMKTGEKYFSHKIILLK